MFREILTKRILVLGCGNVLMGDDGFGPAVVKKLQQQYDLPADVHVEDVGTSVRDVLFNITLLDQRPEHVIVLDAVDKPDRKDGEVFEISLDEIPAAKLTDYSFHQFPTSNLLKEIQEQAGLRVTIIAAQIAGKLGQFLLLVEANPALKEVLSSPAFRMEERKRVFDQVIKKLGWGSPLDRFLWYLVEHQRVALLEAIVETFTSMVDEREGKVRVRVESAKPLDSSEEAILKKALADGLKKQVVMEPSQDPSLLAGIKVRIGDLVVDGSLKTQLDNLKNILTKQQA